MKELVEDSMCKKMFSNRTVLVTGGAGFIGSHLCERLLYLGYRVICIDDLNDFYNISIKKSNLQEIKSFIEKNNICSENFMLYIEDIRNANFLNDMFENNKIDSIIHLAAYAGVRPSILRPSLYMDVNVNGTVNLLEGAKKWGIRKFIFASSSSVYGNNTSVPFSETSNVDRPISPYAASKKAAELVCYTYHHLYKINIACLRFFTVYGPRQRPDLAIHKFTDLLYNGEEIPVFGDGTTERDYTYVDDILDGIVKSLEWVSEESNRFEIFNLGGSNTISLNRLIEVLESVVGKKAKLKKLPTQQGDVQRTFADIYKAKSLLGYNPVTEFETGISKFFDWYKYSSYHAL